MNRRTFITALPLIPALPRKRTRKLESPKGAEQSTSLQRISVQAIPSAPATIAPRIVPAGPFITGINVQAGVVTITWQGGHPPYQLQRKASINGPWSNVGSPTMQTTASVPVAGPEAYFRFQSTVQLAEVTREAGVTKLTWGLPDV